jgi:hypothetical protein
VLLDHEEYEQARATLAALCSHVEIEIYLDDTMNDMTSPVED